MVSDARSRAWWPAAAAIRTSLRAGLSRVQGWRSFTEVDEQSTAVLKAPERAPARAVKGVMPRWVVRPAMAVDGTLLALAVIAGALLRFLNLGGIGLNSD